MLFQTADQINKTRRKTLKSNVRLLSQVSKSDKENIPFVADHGHDLPIYLQTKGTINCDDTRVALSKPRLKSKITILFDEKIMAGPSNISGSNTSKSFKDQHARSKSINIQRKRASVGLSALHTKIIPKKVKKMYSVVPNNFDKKNKRRATNNKRITKIQNEERFTLFKML